jgi:chloramphenicol-sensitive protein RarD
VSPQRAGLLAAIFGNLLWGLFPLYWPLLEPAKPVEILAHRIAWSLLFLLAVLAATRGFAWVRTLDRRRAGLLALSACLISVNWGMYIYAVNSDRVIEGALGYFISPLVSVALAVVVLRERLRARQRVAVLIAAIGVVVLTLQYGHPPWIALTLATSFAVYGLVKKRVGLDGTESLTVETTFLVTPAVAYLLWLGADGSGTFTSEGAGHAALLATGGAVTALPLMLFGAAAIRIPLTQLGLLQYLTPSIQWLIGVVVDGEAMPAGRLAGFLLVWVALAIFALDAARTARAAPPPAPRAVPRPRPQEELTGSRG